MQPASKRRASVLTTMLFSFSVHAHHAMGGLTPATFSQGLLSGLAHPVIGIDHFAAVLAIGLIASLSSQRTMLIVAFFASTLCGVGLHVAKLNLPMSEAGIALSLVAFGWLLMRASVAPLVLTATVVVAAGVLHGYAYGESIVGAEATPLGAYLLGLALIQASIAVCAAVSARFFFRAYPVLRERLSVASGALLALLGVALLSV